MSRIPTLGLILVLLGCVCWGLSPLPAAAQSGPVVAINQAITDGFPEMEAYVTVVSASGLPISALTETAFQVLEDGRPVSGFSVAPAREQGIHIILGMDASGSMLGGQALQDARAAARTFVSQLTERDQAALIVFSESAELAADFTANRDPLEAAIDAITVTPLARTALYEAVVEAAERMSLLPAGRKASVIFTDGTDTVGGFSLKDAVDRAREANVPVYTVGLLGGEFDPAPMRQLSEGTGGTYLEAPTSEQLVSQFQLVRDILEQQYLIRFTSGIRPENRPHELTISVQTAEGAASDSKAFLPVPLAPWVAISAPQDSEAVAGTVPVAADVVARGRVDRVVFSVDGTPVAELAAAPYRYAWDAGATPSGDHVLSITATDDEGRVGAAEARVLVEPALSLTLKAPADGVDVVGAIDVRPDVHAVRQVKQVTIAVDGANVATLTATPYVHRWDTSALTSGSHTLTVEAEDEAGARASVQVQVNVLPALTVALTTPSAGADVVGVVDVQPDIAAVNALAEAAILVDGQQIADVKDPPHTHRWDTALLPPGPHKLAVNVRDDHGLTGQAEVQVNVLPVLTVAWVKPQAGGSFTETVTLLASATGHYGVESVEFRSNGELLGAVRQPPYQLEWPTLSLEEGNYRLSVCAYDVRGHEACAERQFPLKRPSPGWGPVLAMGVLLVTIVGVMAMVIRSRRRPAPARHPEPIVYPQGTVRPVRDSHAENLAPERPLTPQPRRVDPPTAATQEAARAGSERATKVDGSGGAGSAAPAGWLVLDTPGAGPKRRFALKPHGTAIGRAPENDIRIDDELVSRQHAKIRYDVERGGYVLQDLSPTNPSQINGQEYSEAQLLRPGDRIQMGDSALTFQQDS